MQTSYFAKYRGDCGVSIAASAPKGFTGSTYALLVPFWSMVRRYKASGDEDAYTLKYYELVLNRLDPEQVWQDLQDKVLLCWERPGVFCHRHLVAEWLELELGVKVPEL